MFALLAGYLVARALRSASAGSSVPRARSPRATSPTRSAPTPTTSSASSRPRSTTCRTSSRRLSGRASSSSPPASHELRTPIFSLGGFLELIADEDLDDETRRQFLEQLRGQVERLRKLAAELLDLSRIEAARSSCGRSRPTSASSRARSRGSSPGRAAARIRRWRSRSATSRSSSNATPAGLRSSYPARQRPRPHAARAPAYVVRRAAERRVRLEVSDADRESEARTCPRSSIRSSPPTRGAGRRPRPGDRPRAGRADAGPADGRSAPGATTFTLVLPAMRRASPPRSRRLALAVAGCGGGDGADERGRGRRRHAAPATTTSRSSRPRRRAGGFDPKAIYENEAPGVVTVVSLFGSGGLDALLGGGGGGGGLGSGFVLNGRARSPPTRTWSRTGGRHPRARAQVFVEFADGNRVTAEIIGDDPNADIALLKVDPKGLDAAPAAARRGATSTSASRSPRSARPFGERAVALGRRRLGDRPRHRVADRLPHPGRDPDRRRDQPRQLGRPAGRRRGPGDRDQPADQVAPPAAARASASRSRWTSSSARSTSCETTARPLRVPRRLHAGSTRSSPSSFDLAVDRAPGSRRSTRAARRRRPAPRRRRRGRPSRPRPSGPAATSSPKVGGKPIGTRRPRRPDRAYAPGEEVELEVRRDGDKRRGQGEARAAPARRRPARA